MNKFKPIIKLRNSEYKTVELEALLRSQHGKCFYCRRLMTERTRDHLFPRVMGFSKGGNSVFACPSCNQQKDRRMPFPKEVIDFVKTIARTSQGSSNLQKFSIVALRNNKPRFKLIITDAIMNQCCR